MHSVRIQVEGEEAVESCPYCHLLLFQHLGEAVEEEGRRLELGEEVYCHLTQGFHLVEEVAHLEEGVVRLEEVVEVEWISQLHHTVN